MKKTVLILMCGIFCTLSGEIFFSAKDARGTTNQATKKLYAEVLSSEKGKAAYKGLSQFFNNNIAEITSKGYYDQLVITIHNSRELGIKSLMQPLDRMEQNIIREVLIKELEAKGYKVTKNEFWDNLDSFNITVSW